MGADDVLLWPGQDGFDYPFQVDYDECWVLLIDGIGEVASHRPDVKVSIEYKPKEPRTNLFVRNAGVLLYLLDRIGLPNVGATVDLGHSLVAGENPAEAATLLAREGKLFQVHVNDNYRDWDHDLIVGSVSFWETLEFLYWIRKSGYDGWYVVDVFPYREDGFRALQQCVRNIERLLDLADSLMKTDIRSFMEKADAISSFDVLWDSLLG
jgi:xylose isomerase